jgi:putative DNA methylase
MKTSRKKLIEVALPLEAINKASAREKSIRHGHPSTLHLWWARRPLAAARAVIFAQMVDDPSEYVATLLEDPKLKRRAESDLKAKHQLWEDAKALHDKAAGTGLAVPEPGIEPTLNEVIADHERQRLFRIIEELVLWENTTNETVLQKARDEIWQSWRRTCAQNADHPRAKELFDRKALPAFHDPFAGGGALPLEAQRLGLESYATDLNPVAVLINKAMIEIPPKFASKPPVNPDAQKQRAQMGKLWHGAQGIAEDVRYYGQWMRDEAEKRIGHLYPTVEVTAKVAKERPDLSKYVGQKLTVIAWLWARTVKSPNPAFADVDVPLASTFMLSAKPGEQAYVSPVISGNGYAFEVRSGEPTEAAATKNGTKLARANFRCLISGAPISGDYLKAQGKAGRLGARLMAIVAEGSPGRVFLSPTLEHESVALKAAPEWVPDVEFFQQALGFRVGNYGMTKWSDLFTQRQLKALDTFSGLVHETCDRIRRDAFAAGLPDNGAPLRDGGGGAVAYAEALGVYLGFSVSRMADRHSSLCRWDPNPSGYAPKIANTFGRQALPMVWDFAEGNPFSPSSGNLLDAVGWVAKVVETSLSALIVGTAAQSDAGQQQLSESKVVSTDPPYYDNIGYADLSDFFYVWLRRSLKAAFPELFGTVSVPKADELVATPGRHGGREKAEAFFLAGMTNAIHQLAGRTHPAFPITIYYAFKQAESDEHDGTASTGWETFLDAVVRAGLTTTGTWPIRTELSNRMRGANSNALASSIVLVCRTRAANAPTVTRRELVNALKGELPKALFDLQRGNIAPVDLAQAAIGPGMAVYTRYASVLDAEGRPLSVRDALALINQTLDEALAEQEGDFDPDTRWALTWFEQSGFDEGEYGVAEQLSKSKNTAVAGLVSAGIVTSKAGKVRLLRPNELVADWDPATDLRLSTWESVHHLIRTLEKGGEGVAADLVAKLGARAEVARELAYRLYTLCERKKRATEALSYNALVQSWPEITRLAREDDKPTLPTQKSFGDNEE